ncbi:MAG: rubrerythrin family protein [Euryarchaeota archaeon]|nr:rubrerythrin family protein [Euryarchaeota archaeon]
MSASLEPALLRKVLEYQKNEITEYHVYSELAKRSKNNAEVLRKIGKDELGHYKYWVRITGREVEPDRRKIKKYLLISKIFGVTFAIKMMERGEGDAQENYSSLVGKIDGIEAIIEDEEKHEELLIDMIKEEKIEYVGSMVLGLNDALVELTGALAGLSFALQNTKLIGFVGLITGLAAAMSMASSEYLSKKSEKFDRPGRAATYTGIAYFLTVMLLIAPYFILDAYYFALIATLLLGLFAIFIFTFFVAVVKDMSFKRLFVEMALISFGIAGISFLIGVVIRVLFGVDM